MRGELKNTYIFFDEIQHVPDWQVILKRYYDSIKGIKFVVSGSASLFMRKAKESLAGRIYEFEIKPLTFEEFLYLRGFEVKDMLLQKFELEKLFYEYVIHGGLPEMIFERDFEKLKKYVNSIIEKIIFFDIPKTFDVKDPFILKEIVDLLAKNPGMLVDFGSLASTLKISRQTVSKYMKYLEKAFLIKLLGNYRGSEFAIARKAKKAYFTSHSLLLPSFETEEEFLSSLSFLVENIVINQLNANFFWKDSLGEINILYRKIPIEIKFKEKIEKKDLRNILRFGRKFKSKKAILITKDLEKEERINGMTVHYVPIIKFLLKYSEILKEE